MSWWNDLRMQGKLLAAFSAVLALTTILGGTSIWILRQATSDARVLGVGEMGGLKAVLELQAAVRTVQRDVRQGMIVTSAEANAKWKATFYEADSAIVQRMDTLKVLLLTEQGRRLHAQLQDAVTAWRPLQQQIAELNSRNQLDQARRVLLSAENDAAASAVNRAVAALVQQKDERAAATVAQLDRRAFIAQGALWLTLGAAIAIGFGIAILLSRRIATTLGGIVERQKALAGNCVAGLSRGMDALARGDLTTKVVPSTQAMVATSNDELGELARTFNVMVEQTKMSIDAFGRAQQVIRDLLDETSRLASAGRDGQLGVRGEAARFEGAYRELVGGMNATLDAVLMPMNEAATVLERTAQRDLTATVQGEYRGDHAKIKDALNAAIAEMQNTIGTIASSAQALASSSEELSAVTTQMGSTAEETSAQAGVVSAAAEQVSKSVQTVATGTEEMSASIREIAKNASEASRVASRAVGVAEQTSTTVVKLGQSSEEIGAIIKTITSIAQQTNLLALNATIEAARAGEAGKGFAVVATEVKELAKETARATEDISDKIVAIQQETRSAVDAIREINEIIAQIHDIQATIAGAVEEQTATTNEMSRNVSEAARGSQEIAANIAGVAKAAEETSGGAQNGQQASTALATMASELQDLVRQFHLAESAGVAGASGRRRDAAERSDRKRPEPNRIAAYLDAGHPSRTA
jgi:methyl-accepting chemotaxis protein